VGGGIRHHALVEGQKEKQEKKGFPPREKLTEIFFGRRRVGYASHRK